ncbi:hypothetical protein, partial [Pseudarthrobacter scleromae]|uniref:hypothetical protein n=1 Tax=Pseudarthrobacter scleromae TaxID=158897 RepID=UPI003D07B6F1
ALDKTGKYGRITNVNVAHFSTHEMAQFSTVADRLAAVGRKIALTCSDRRFRFFIAHQRWP